METLIEQIQKVLNEASKYSSLNQEITTNKFVDGKTKKEYNSLEEAFKEGITDLSNFKKINTKVNPKIELSKLINNDLISNKQIQIVNQFNKLVKDLDSDSQYKREYTRLSNKKSKAKKEGNIDEVDNLTKEINELNRKYNKQIRSK